MLKAVTTLASFILLSLPTSLLSAHEGHGHASGQGHSPSHYLTEPIHLLQLGTLLLAAISLTYLASRRLHQTSQRPSNLV